MPKLQDLTARFAAVSLTSLRHLGVAGIAAPDSFYYKGEHEIAPWEVSHNE